MAKTPRISKADRKVLDELLSLDEYYYVYSPIFDTDEDIFCINIEDKVERSRVIWNNLSNGIRDSSGNDGLLTAKEEKYSFYQYNYLRYQVSVGLEHFEGDTKSAKHIIRNHREAIRIRDNLVILNGRLIPRVIRRYGMIDQFDFDELFGVGSVPLMRAVDKFDVNKGFKFSTYAWHSVARGLFRHCEEHPWLEFSSDYKDHTEPGAIFKQFALVDKEDQIDTIMRVIKTDKEITPQEAEAIRLYYLIGAQQMTTREIGKIMGVSRNSIEKYLKSGLEKIRTALNPVLEENSVLEEVC